MLRSSASCHMPSRQPHTPPAASPTKSTNPVAVKPCVNATRYVAHHSAPPPRHAAPAHTIAHPSSTAASGSLVAATTTAAAMDGRMDGSDGPPSEAGRGTRTAAARQRDLISKIRARQSTRNRETMKAIRAASSGKESRDLEVVLRILPHDNRLPPVRL